MMIFDAILGAIRKTFVYSGRSERLEHWSFWLFTALCAGAVCLVDRYIGSINQVPINWLVLVLALWLTAANASLIVRRLHDSGITGFVLFIPLACAGVWMFGSDQMVSADSSFMSAQTAKVVAICGRIGTSMSGLAIATYFVRAGESDANKFGDPV